jgi:hypothetical protein
MRFSTMTQRALCVFLGTLLAVVLVAGSIVPASAMSTTTTTRGWGAIASTQTVQVSPSSAHVRCRWITNGRIRVWTCT